MYLTYAAPRGHAFVDRALYLPRSWTEDDQRRAAAGVRTDIWFATKPKARRAVITRAVDAEVPAAVNGDEVYGADPGLRRTVRKHGLGYVLRVDQLPGLLPAWAWHKRSAGTGGTGKRVTFSERLTQNGN